MLLAMWSFVHWQDGKSILQAFVLKIAELDGGTSGIMHLVRNFSMLSTESHYCRTRSENPNEMY
jgi:hypothetical protein